MRQDDAFQTPVTLLKESADWQNSEAFRRVYELYHPYIRACCSFTGLDSHSIDEIEQEIWIELPTWLKSFCYDPSKPFRFILRQLCRHRTLDFLRRKKRQNAQAVPLESLDSYPWQMRPDEEFSSPELLELMQHAEQAQLAVQGRVEKAGWQAFWLITVELMSVEDAAVAVGKSKAATYQAMHRVREQLQKEAKRLTSQLPDSCP